MNTAHAVILGGDFGGLNAARQLADAPIRITLIDRQKVLDELSDAYRSSLSLVDVLELDYSEASQALKIPIGTLKSRLARAPIQMQKKLKDESSQERNISCAQPCFAL